MRLPERSSGHSSFQGWVSGEVPIAAIVAHLACVRLSSYYYESSLSVSRRTRSRRESASSNSLSAIEDEAGRGFRLRTKAMVIKVSAAKARVQTSLLATGLLCSSTSAPYSFMNEIRITSLLSPFRRESLNSLRICLEGSQSV